MKLFFNSFKMIASMLALVVLAACTSTSVDQGLTPQTTNAQTVTTQDTALVTQSDVQTANINQQTDPNALAAQTTPTPTQNVTENQLQQPAATQTPTATQEIASLDTSRAMTFLPFEGAPQSKTASLTRFLNTSAQSNGLAILPATRAGAKYRVKGYFSALNDGNGTLLVYVWDVVDGTGKRLHRINGRERTGTTKTDPWQAITDAEIERVARDTTARLKTWVDKRS